MGELSLNEIKGRVRFLRSIIKTINRERKDEPGNYGKRKCTDTIKRYVRDLKPLNRALIAVKKIQAENPEEFKLISEINRGLDEYFKEMSGN